VLTGSFDDYGTSPLASAATISFSVSVLDSLPTLSISGAHLAADFSVPQPGYADLSAAILHGGSLESIQLFSTNLGGVVTTVDEGQTSFTPSSELSVVVDDVDAFVSLGTVGISAIYQSFTVVPEPSTSLLIGLGLVGLGVAGNRRD